ncbi:ankyrin [Eremomyces bilateralis CBS 781.70]|uniref:Ankyrin n=1 Tax=Eremomyces bilateralis CBS 781.70 TaxID=1392243 RepID=A0A6G1FY84_9PEZI|nr:ankyrin [Eremomyces bilateralis CBS 781.70]KAF1810734.1 ankyrin [Eremomyces bilateralis CBS 781.70]
MINVCTRLRRAIVRNDLRLVQRIVRSNPNVLQNPDYGDKSNTSLHLACKQGFIEIAEFLVEAGHDDETISYNGDGNTPLMTAAEAGHVDIAQMLIETFPRCVPWANSKQQDALMLACKSGALPLLPILLAADHPADLAQADADGNTALHHASAAGELKAIRLLLQHGASPLAQNRNRWTPIQYSATAAAELYFKNLVAEFEKRRVEGMKEAREWERERDRQRMGGVRLVTSEEAGVVPSTGHWDWSPVEARRAMTPTTGRSEPFVFPSPPPAGPRARARSGD